MSIIYRAPLVFPATAAHTATVIFLHGLGDTGHGWEFAVENWRRRQRLDEVKFILPHAPRIPITVNRGMRMPGWYDIVEMGGDPDSLRKHEDQEGILRTQKHVHELIQQEIDSGIPADRIVLGGFSQGGAVSIFAGLTAKVKLAGIVALSAYLLLSQQFASLVPKPEVNKNTPIFMGHGDSDEVVHTQLGQLSQSMLNVQGYNVTFKVYEDLGHSATPEELDDVEEFLKNALPPKGGKAEGKPEL
ncbi:Phospholipase/carboxylesterase/thioesterase [Podospora aff. communis PSN243]|uniref:Acyl-protein thioesterase 1 n=1 Tax=Podospora aff. communis PSN243 TaxID=3040156 RepID=A0AAV9H236_9PEZI|nr:Phospholipase/carboxylesterase/thioesterase [Podospora aff. communis PSN243]